MSEENFTNEDAGISDGMVQAAGSEHADLLEEIRQEAAGDAGVEPVSDSADDQVDDEDEESDEGDDSVEEGDDPDEDAGDDGDDDYSASDEAEEDKGDKAKKKRLGKRKWRIEPERPGFMDEEYFQEAVKQSGMSEVEMAMKIVQGMKHKMIIRGKKVDVNYEGLVANAQKGLAYEKKSNAMKSKIADGTLIDSIRRGTGDGKLALKEVLAMAKQSFAGDSDIDDMLNDVMEMEGSLDRESLDARAEDDADYEEHFGDVVDTKEYPSIINTINTEVKTFLPKAVLDEVKGSYRSSRQIYDLVKSGDWEDTKDIMRVALDSLGREDRIEVESNARDYFSMYAEVVKESIKAAKPNQPGESDDDDRAFGSKRKVSTSRRARKPHSSKGKIIKSRTAKEDLWMDDTVDGDKAFEAKLAKIKGGVVL